MSKNPQNENKNSQKSCLVVQKLVNEGNAFVRAELENMKSDARKELDRRKMAEFRRNLAERMRTYSSFHNKQIITEMAGKTRMSEARKIYGSVERNNLIRSGSIKPDCTSKTSTIKYNSTTPVEMKNLKELIKLNEKRLDEIPSICQCRSQWKSCDVNNFEMCANNCNFYNNQKGMYDLHLISN